MKNIQSPPSSQKESVSMIKKNAYDTLQIDQAVKSTKNIRLASVASSQRVGAVDDTLKSDYWSVLDLFWISKKP